jgi:tight adherence protein B
MSLERLINLIIVITVFGLVFSVWCICVFIWLGQYLVRLKAIQKRLSIVVKETDESRILRLWRDTQRDIKKLEWMPKPNLRERLETLRQDTGWQTPIQLIILGVIGVAICAFAATYILGGSLLLGLGVIAVVITVFWSYTQRRITRREILFERQFADALGIAARSLRAGHPLVGAFRLISEEIGDPLGDIFFKICQEQTLGSNLKESIRKVAKTTSSPDLKLFATAVAIQLHSGGNLADLMDSLGSIARVRMRIRRRFRVLTAQTQFSKRILIALPVVLFFLLNVLNPQYMQPLYVTSMGRYMLAAMILSVSLGFWMMNRISVLRF